VVDHVLRPPLRDGHLERIQHQLGAQMVGHRPADDPTAEGIQHNREGEEARERGNVRDVRHPQLVRCLGREVAVDKIRRRPRLPITPRRRGAALPVAGPRQAGRTHEARDPLAAVVLSGLAQLGMNARRPVGLARGGVDRAHPREQGGVRLGAGRG